MIDSMFSTIETTLRMVKLMFWTIKNLKRPKFQDSGLFYINSEVICN